MIEVTRLSAYRVMWLFVFFDLPTSTKKERGDAAKFRKELERDGFNMMQYSVYIRHCPSVENKEVHVKRIRAAVPEKGHVAILAVTDKQFGMIVDLWGARPRKNMEASLQLTLF